MWTPTHVQITVNRARNLCCKGKAGTNDSYAVIQLGKNKFQTQIRERSIDPEWREECEFPIADVTIQSAAKVTLFHRNLLGLDEFLGRADIPLDQSPIYQKPCSRWYTLQGKPGTKKLDKNRGEVEVMLTFIVHSMSQSQMTLNQSELSSRKSVSSSIRNLAHNVGDRLNTKWSSRTSLSRKSGNSDTFSSTEADFQQSLKKASPTEPRKSFVSLLDASNQYRASSLVNVSQPMLSVSSNEDPSRNSESSPRTNMIVSSSNGRPVTAGAGTAAATDANTFFNKSNSLSRDRSKVEFNNCGASEGGEELTLRVSDGIMATKRNVPLSKHRGASEVSRFNDRSSLSVAVHELHEMHEYARTKEQEQESCRTAVMSGETLEHFKNYEKEDVVRLLLEQQKSIVAKDAYIRDLEDYIDDLLVKVIESQPKLLQNPYDRKTVTIGGQRSPPQNNHPSAAKNECGSPKSFVSRSVTHNSLRLVTADTPPGVYVATTGGLEHGDVITNGGTDHGEGETVPALIFKPSRFGRAPHLGGIKDGVKPKRALILSPFKRLQSLIK